MWTPSDTLLARYLSGECTALETTQIEEWAAASVANCARLEELRAIWLARSTAPTWNVEGIWGQVQRAVRTDRIHGLPFRRGPVWGVRRGGIVRIAAAAALVLTVGSGFLLYNRSTRNRPSATAQPAAREYTTARGQRATLQLSDGTRLILAPASRLAIPPTFGHGVREVILDGEALFEVVHDSTKPFRVRARHAIAQDIGTRFDIRGYADDSVVAVAVARGSVALGRADSVEPFSPDEPGDAAQGVVLGQGELGTLGITGEVTMERGAAVDGYLAWAEGRLVFADTPLAEAARRIGRWYNVDVLLDSPELSTRRVTAAFVNESAPEALRFVATVLNLQLSRTGQSYTLRSR